MAGSGLAATLDKLAKNAPTMGQAAASAGTTAVSLAQAVDALMAEITMAMLTHEAREQGLWSVATKQADANSARMAKQSEEWGRI